MRGVQGVAALVAVVGALLAAAPAQAVFPGANGYLFVSQSTQRGTTPPSGGGTVTVSQFRLNPRTSAIVGKHSCTYPNGGISRCPFAFTDLSPDGRTRVGTDGQGLLFTGFDHSVKLVPITGAVYTTSVRWNPAGGDLLAAGERLDGTIGLFRMSLDGVLGKLVIDPADDYSFRGYDVNLSGDLVYTADPPKGSSYNVLKRADGTRQSLDRRLGGLSWSPYGQRLLAVGYGRLSGALYVLHPDGSHRRVLTRKRLAQSPVWSPDGKKIAFVTEHGIYTIGSNGRGLRLVRKIQRNNPSVLNASQTGLVGWEPKPALTL